MFSHHHLLFLILQQEDSFAQYRKIKGNRPRPTTARLIGCGVLSSTTKLNLLPTLVADVRSRPQGQRTLANATLDWIQEVTRPFNQEVGVSNAMRTTPFRRLAIEAMQTYSLSLSPALADSYFKAFLARLYLSPANLLHTLSLRFRRTGSEN